MLNIRKILFIGGLILLLSSCAFTATRLGENTKYGQLFPAITTDVEMMTDSGSSFLFGKLRFIAILDLPISLTTDLIILPCDLILMAVGSDNNAKKQP